MKYYRKFEQGWYYILSKFGIGITFRWHTRKGFTIFYKGKSYNLNWEVL